MAGGDWTGGWTGGGWRDGILSAAVHAFYRLRFMSVRPSSSSSVDCSVIVDAAMQATVPMNNSIYSKPIIVHVSPECEAFRTLENSGKSVKDATVN